MARITQRDSRFVPLLLAVTSVLLGALAILLWRGEAMGWEWIIVLGLAGAFVVFAVVLPLTGPTVLCLRAPRGRAWAQLAMGLVLFLFFLAHLPVASASGSEVAVLADVLAGLVGSGLAFQALYPRH